MKDVTEGLAELSLEDRLVQAVRKFEQKQQAGNKAWLEAQIKQCEAGKNPTRARNDFAKLFKFDSWDSLVAKHGISAPSQLLSVDLAQDDTGTCPPVPEDERKTFLSTLQNAINEQYDQESPEYHETTLPEDYGLLLSLTDGVRDTDLRGDRVCGIDGTRTAKPEKMTYEDLIDMPGGNDLWRLGWDVDTGFILGSTANPSCRPHQWLVYYYCRRDENTPRGPQRRGKGEIKDHERPWRWRLFYKENERFQHSFFDAVVFKDIADWLEFYGDWWHRESVEYPAWSERMARDVEILYPDNPEQEGDSGPE